MVVGDADGLGGASIQISLPRLRSSIEKKLPDPASDPPSSIEGAVGLVVDDDSLVADVVAGMLESLGYAAHVKTSPMDALEALETEGEIHFVLSDFQMAGMSGAGLLSAARERGHFQPFVFMTGYGGPMMVEAIDPAESVWLEKPISRNRLAEAIAAALCQPPETTPTKGGDLVT